MSGPRTAESASHAETLVVAVLTVGTELSVPAATMDQKPRRYPPRRVRAARRDAGAFGRSCARRRTRCVRLRPVPDHRQAEGPTGTAHHRPLPRGRGSRGRDGIHTEQASRGRHHFREGSRQYRAARSDPRRPRGRRRPRQESERTRGRGAHRRGGPSCPRRRHWPCGRGQARPTAGRGHAHRRAAGRAGLHPLRGHG